MKNISPKRNFVVSLQTIPCSSVMVVTVCCGVRRNSTSGGSKERGVTLIKICSEFGLHTCSEIVL